MQTWQRGVVTGASSGIGESFARTLAAAGSDLVLVARREGKLNDLAAELRDRSGVEVEVLTADLTEATELLRVEQRLADEARPIDLLVNNAGGSERGGRGAFAELPRDLVENQALLNAVAVLRLTHAAVEAMKPHGRGSVIQVSAGVAFYPVPYGATYAASKAFVNSFSEAVNFELRGSGVHVTTVCPGFTRTDAPRRIGFSESNVPPFLWSDPEEVVQAALAAAAKGKSLVSPSRINKVNAAIGAHFPRSMMRFATGLTKR